MKFPIRPFLKASGTVRKSKLWNDDKILVSIPFHTKLIDFTELFHWGYTFAFAINSDISRS